MDFVLIWLIYIYYHKNTIHKKNIKKKNFIFCLLYKSADLFKFQLPVIYFFTDQINVPLSHWVNLRQNNKHLYLQKDKHSTKRRKKLYILY